MPPTLLEVLTFGAGKTCLVCQESLSGCGPVLWSNSFDGGWRGRGGGNCSLLNLENCASLWKNPGYAPECSKIRTTLYDYGITPALTTLFWNQMGAKEIHFLLYQSSDSWQLHLRVHKAAQILQRANATKFQQFSSCSKSITKPSVAFRNTSASIHKQINTAVNERESLYNSPYPG